MDHAPSPTDMHFLLHAARIAERGLGRTSPNPSVGCVIVNDGRVVGVTRTGDGGRPHAEALALEQAGDAARGATTYVTLEPCAHHGKTPPCAEALIKAGVARVVIGAIDPDKRVSGKGIAMLKEAGIEVVQIAGEECVRINRGFFRRLQHNMPYTAVKLATSADDFMVRNDGGGQWLTNEFARQHGHTLRARHDCILTGIGTALADDPLLNVRGPAALHQNLLRVVADRKLRLPLSSKLVKSAGQSPLTIITTPDGIEHAAGHAEDLRMRGVNLIALEYVTPAAILSALAEQGITRLLIEAGPELSGAFLKSGLVNSLHLYRAKMTLGNAGAAPINGLETLLAGTRSTAARALGDDTYQRYEFH